MGKTRKKFIDKKTAHHFYLMHRSQQDPLYYRSEQEGGSRYVLQPANEKTAVALEALDEYATQMNETDEEGSGKHTKSSVLQTIAGHTDAENNQFSKTLKKQRENQQGKGTGIDEIDEYGFPKDGYDYHKHLAPITGDGVFVGLSGKVLDHQPAEKGDPKARRDEGETFGSKQKSVTFQLPQQVLASEKEYDRMLEAITLKEETMDPEIRHLLNEDLDALLFGEADEEEIEQEKAEDSEVGGLFSKLNADRNTLLDDDFVMQLVKKEEENNDQDDFDFDKHVQRLMKQAEATDELEDSDIEVGSLEEEAEEDMDELERKLKAATRRPEQKNRKLRDVDYHFENFLAKEYDEEQIGEGVSGSEDELVDLVEEQVSKPVGDADATSEMSSEAVSKILVHDKVFVKREIVDSTPGEAAEDCTEGDQDGIATLDKLTEQMKAVALHSCQVDEEKSLHAEESDELEKLDKISVLQQFAPCYEYKAKPQFDCQTIVSTYSTTENHPTMISVSNKKAMRRRNKTSGSQAQQRARERNQSDSDDEEAEEVGLSQALQQGVSCTAKREKTETKEEKRLRKQRVKELKRYRRTQKKGMKQMFKEEKSNQTLQSIKRKEAAVPPEGVSNFRI